MLIRTLLAVGPTELAGRLERSLRRNPLASVAAVDPAALWESLMQHAFDLLLISRDALPGDPAVAVATIRGLPDRPDVVVLEPDGDPAAAGRAELLAAGCLAVVSWHLPDTLLDETLGSFLERRREQALARLGSGAESAPCSLDDFDSAAPSMRQMLRVARAVAPAESNVLILGETGTGKERLARALHASSPRLTGPFIAVNSGAVTESLVESELFGHERGAFTGALRTRRGYFEQAHGGTIFFDEISEMPLALQVKLLRVLEERSIRRVGGESEVGVDVRVMAATNRDLAAEVDAGRFREDLYYRLVVVTLHVIPLRERREDLPGLIDRLLPAVCNRLGHPVPRLAPDTWEALLAHHWPGNVRELLNTLERLVLLCSVQNASVASCAFLESLHARRTDTVGAIPPDNFLREPGWSCDRRLLEARKEIADAFERAYLIDLMRTCHGRVGEGAERAGVSTRSLSDMLKRHGLRLKRSWSEEVVGKSRRGRATVSH